jgi:hypothetical protein
MRAKVRAPAGPVFIQLSKIPQAEFAPWSIYLV